MKDLLARQAKLNTALDLDKNERQIAEPDSDDDPEVSATFVAREMERVGATMQR